MKKKAMALTVAAMMAAAMITGCGQTAATTVETAADTTVQTEESTADTESTAADTAAADGESYTIGISQFAEHGSLDNCRTGFLEGLKEAGIEEGVNLTVLFDNAQADTATASMISDNYVSQKVDLICAIATPSAMSAYNSCLDSDIPVIYTAVSDPVSAGLAKEDKTPEGNITGTADTLPVEAQLKMIREVLPDATKIGILYTTSEANSLSTIETYKELADDYGFEIVESGINTLADVDMAAADLAAKVDCISNLTDNTVVQGLQTVLLCNVLSNQLCIAVRSLDFFDVNQNLFICQLGQLFLGYFDFCAALTDYNAGLCGIKDNLYSVGRSLDFNLGNACRIQFLL